MNYVPLGSVCAITMGQAPIGSTYNTDRVGLPLIAGASDLGEITPKPARWTSAPTMKCIAGDIILCIRATIGDRNWADREYCLGRGVAGLRAKPGRLEPRFLWYSLAFTAPELLHAARGATFLQVGRKDIEGLIIPAPSIDEQRRIADILDRADAMMGKRKQAIALTEDLLRSTFIDMFGDQSRTLNGWPTSPLEELCSNIVDCPHTTPRYEGNNRPHPCIRTSDLQDGYFDLSTSRYVSEAEYNERIARLEPLPGDIFYTREGERFGIAALLPPGVRACLGQRMMLLRANPAVATPEFLWGALNAPGVYRQARAEVGGSTSPHVNVKAIRRFVISRPPMTRQRAYSEICQRLAPVRLNQIEAFIHASRLFDTLVDRAFATRNPSEDATC